MTAATPDPTDLPLRRTVLRRRSAADFGAAVPAAELDRPVVAAAAAARAR